MGLFFIMRRNNRIFLLQKRYSQNQGYRTFCVFFNVNEASVYRALLAFIFSEKIFEGGQKVL